MSIATADRQTPTPVILRNLTLRVGGRTLLKSANVRFEPDQITLIVGPSGAGKSMLLRVLAGLADSFSAELQVSGTISFGDRNGAAPATVGMVFQKFALFDELSPVDNVRLARDHRPSTAGSVPDGLNPAELLAELDVPQGVPTGALSGGQQQRLAIARTLACEPAVILYDEPTSGLDVATAERVAGLIRKTQEHHPKTSIIVTHDYDPLAPIADHVYLLDSRRQELREIAPEQWSALGEMMRALAGAEKEVGGAEPAQLGGQGGRLRRMAGFLVAFFSGTTLLLEQVVALPVRLLPLWRSGYWGGRFCWHFLRLVAGPLAMLYVALAGVVAGFVATYFTFHFLPYRPITEPLFLENVLEALGFSLYRILVPVLITILVAARCGAAVASDVGGKVHGQQIDALRSLGIRPERYLLGPILYAFLLGTPLLVFLAFLLARFTSLCVFTASHPDLGPYFWNAHFHRALLWQGHLLFGGTGWLLAKLLCCAAGMALSSYLVGMLPKRSTRDVSGGITLNILLSTIYVLLVHMTFALFEFD